MLTIGEFSRICRVSTKTLRYYEAIGLLQPRLVNPATGYRFYTADQLGPMRLINRLKAYNFTLEEIKLLVVTFNGERSSLSAALQEKKQELLRQKTLLNQRLRQLDADIENLRQGCTLFNSGDEIAVELTEMPAMTLLSLRFKVREGDFPQAYQQSFHILLDKLRKQRLTMNGLPMTLFHDDEFSEEGLDTEFAIPVRETTHETRLFQPGLCLKTVVSGPDADFPAVYARQIQWAEAEGYYNADALFDVYRSDPRDDPQAFCAEVYYPVRK